MNNLGSNDGNGVELANAAHLGIDVYELSDVGVGDFFKGLNGGLVDLNLLILPSGLKNGSEFFEARCIEGVIEANPAVNLLIVAYPPFKARHTCLASSLFAGHDSLNLPLVDGVISDRIGSE